MTKDELEFDSSDHSVPVKFRRHGDEQLSIWVDGECGCAVLTREEGRRVLAFLTEWLQDEPSGNAARSRPWFCEAHGQQWSNECPYCVQAERTGG